MHKERIEIWQHEHKFGIVKKENELRTSIVVVITFLAMGMEIIVGWLTNSMALFADGWHMGTHAFALGISVMAYILARKFSKDERFTFGTWKIEILGAYSSAVILGLIGMIMVYTSVERLLNPMAIAYDQALIVAVIGLLVNVVCVFILGFKNHSHGFGHDHDHGDQHAEAHSHEDHQHEEAHDHGDHQHVEAHDHGDHASSHGNDHADLNLKSSYLHVLADALTSVFAIFALLGAKFFHFNWLDPFMGIVGAALIIRWSFLLLKDTSSILLDRQANTPLAQTIKEKMESDGETKICDLHLWKVEQNRYACIVALVTGQDFQIDEFKKRLAQLPELVHVTIEVNACQYNLV
jgi:cation diffusion facilitator family transporter